MTNNLRGIRKGLCAFAKKCKGFKYTDSALITFLITGAVSVSSNLFSAEKDGNIENQKQILSTDIKDFNVLIKEARKENNKLMKNTNLELVKLMEQGDHVVKAPWSSWQFGANYMYSNWNGGYKGKRDKETPFIYYKRDTNSRYAGYTNGKYNITSLKKVIEPVSAIPIDAAVRPKNIQKRPLNINLPYIEEPTVTMLSIDLGAPIEIIQPEITPPSKTINIVNPNANPYSNFSGGFLAFGVPGLRSQGYIGNDYIPQLRKDNDLVPYRFSLVGDNLNLSGGKFYSGVDENGNYTGTSSYSGATQNNLDSFYEIPELENPRSDTSKIRHQSIVSLYNGRWTNKKTHTISGGEYYVAGREGYSEGLYGLPNERPTAEGTAAFLVAGDTNFIGTSTNPIKVNLYGKSAAILFPGASRGGRVTMQNLKVDIHKDNNTVFNILGLGMAYDVVNNWKGMQYSPRFTGSADITLNTKTNTIYAITNYGSGLGIENTGDLVFNGASNIGFSFLTYVPDKSNYIDEIVPNWSTVGETAKDEYKPWVKMDSNHPMKMYGDENVGIFFNRRKHIGFNKLEVGIHQGTFKLYMNIGEPLDSTNPTAVFTQTSEGKLTSNALYTENTVDGNVGVYAISGQRSGIDVVSTDPNYLIPTNPTAYVAGYVVANGKTTSDIYSKDPIHDLYMDEFAIKFGRNAKNGFMFLAKNGTVIDIRDGSSAPGGTGLGQTEFSDGMDGVNTPQALTGKETVVIYSEGKWEKTKTLLTGTGLEGKPTEIKVNQKLNMVSDKGIAFLAKDSGKITVNKDAKAYGYNSVLGYADKGTVQINAAITAKDDIVSPDIARAEEKFNNIGAYATNGGTVTVTGKASINGIGGLANNSSSVVNLNALNNSIESGTQTALAALDGGIVNFGGGTIKIADNPDVTTKETHKNATPFFSDAGSQIKINGHTDINMYNGVLVTEEDSSYASGISSGVKYQGLGQVDVNIYGNQKVTLGSFAGKNLTWNSSTDGTTATSAFYTALPGIPKFNSINLTSGASYKIILTSKISGNNGVLNINAPTVQLDNPTDQYNNLRMADEMVKISSGTTIQGNIGAGSLVAQNKSQGLSMGSMKDETVNSRSGFENEGTVNLTGGTLGSGIAGMSTSFGTIKNGTISGTTASLSIDNGAGLYGTNGSKLINYGTINVTGSNDSNVGIVALGTDTKIKQIYGTDILNTNAKTIEIENHGAINLNPTSNKSIAIYADNNTRTTRNNVTVINDHQLVVGNEGIGIALLSNSPTVPISPSGATAVNHGVSSDQGGIITVTATGIGSDIITGKSGKGIYAEDSDIILNGGDYVIETKDKGIGIFAVGDTNVTGTLEYKYNGSTTEAGMGLVYNQRNSNNTANINVTNSANVKLNNTANTVAGLIGVYTTANSQTLTNKGNITGSSSALEFGIVSNGADVINDTGYSITLGNAASQSNTNVGIYAKGRNTVTNKGTIEVGNNAVGIYGYSVNNENGGLIYAKDNGVAIYTHDTGTSVNLDSGSTVRVGNNQAVGVYSVGTNQNINVNSGSTVNIGNNSFGFVNAGNGNSITSRANGITIGNDTVYVYQNDKNGKVFNYTPITSSSDNNYALYGNGLMENYGAIDFSTGTGNVAVYSTGGTAVNFGTVKIGASDLINKKFGIGMATGYYDETTDTVSNEGTVINRGTIEVSASNSMGMYAVGKNSKAINYGTINLSSEKTVGMYLDHGAVGENWGTIQTTAGGLKSVKGVYLANGSYIKNYGTINIASTDSRSAGIWTDKAENAEENAEGINPLTGINQMGTSTPVMKVAAADDMKEVGGVTVKVPPRTSVATVTDVNGNTVPIVSVDTATVSSAIQSSITVTAPSGVTTLDLDALGYSGFGSSSEVTSFGMYVDTSGIRHTNPVQGLSNLAGLEDINLYFGSEATRYTTAKAIEVGNNIISPYNDALSTVVTAGTTLNVTSANLTWLAQPTKNAITGLLDKLYLVKVPYIAFAKTGDTQTYNFLAGLEERYGVEGLGTREKLLFDKLNGITKGEGDLFAQAVDEMKGHQYSNVQQRVNATGKALDKEFDYLRNEWRNTTKNSNKIKAFGMRDEYNTDTAGIIDYTSDAYGVAYVHENEAVKLGNSSGWYAGAVTNRFKFKDIGKSKEEQTMLKAGIFKRMSPMTDHNGSLQWTIGGDVFAGINSMKRKFLVVDDIFEAKSTYNTYGVSLKNELGYDIRMSERTHLRPYGSLKLEYGRFNDIREDEGEIRLEVEGNDYFSVKPEVGLEFKYVQPLAVKTQLSVGLTAAYENELGRLQTGNRARVGYTSADWYNLEKEKEDRRGNGKFDLNIGIDNTRFGVTVNAGYDTKGHNVRGGIGFRAIY